MHLPNPVNWSQAHSTDIKTERVDCGCGFLSEVESDISAASRPAAVYNLVLKLSKSTPLLLSPLNIKTSKGHLNRTIYYNVEVDHAKKLTLNGHISETKKATGACFKRILDMYFQLAKSVLTKERQDELKK